MSHGLGLHEHANFSQHIMNISEYNADMQLYFAQLELLRECKQQVTEANVVTCSEVSWQMLSGSCCRRLPES